MHFKFSNLTVFCQYKRKQSHEWQNDNINGGLQLKLKELTLNFI